MEALDARAFMEAEFQSAGIFYRTLKTDLALSCPFHEHSGRKQLLQVAFDGSKYHCWSCHARGHYNGLAERLGLRKMPASTAYAYQAADREIDQLTIPRTRPALPPGTDAWTQDWRGLEPEFLARFEARRWYDPQSAAYRILWPVRYNTVLQGWVAGRTDDTTQPKYRNGPPGFHTKRALWPIDDPAVRRLVVLTEGPFSALRLLHRGFPAVATLGAHNWSAAKTTMLRQRALPVRGVVIAMDGDDTGWQASVEIERALRGQFEEVRTFELPEGRDPGDCSDRTLDRLTAECRSVVDSLRARSPA